MAKSLSQLMTQIEKLQKEAASIQSGIVDRIKKEIARHGLTADHLFGSSTPSAASEKAKPGKSKAGKTGAKFADDQGNSWSGFGPKPGWLRAALDAGRSIQEFLAAGAASDSAPTPKAKKPKAAKVVKDPKFADGNGNTWGGMGKRPDWIRAALDSGKSLDDFLVKKPASAAPAKKAKPADPFVAKTSAKTSAKAAAPAKKAAKPAASKKTAGAAAKPASKASTKTATKSKAPAPAKKPAAKKAAAVKAAAAGKKKAAAAKAAPAASDASDAAQPTA